MQLTLETLSSIDEKLAHFLSNFEEMFQSELETKNEKQKQDLFWEALVEAIPEMKAQTLQNLKDICGALIGKAPSFSSFLRELGAKVTPDFDTQVRLSEEKSGFDQEFGTVTAPIIGQFDLGSKVSFDRWEKSVRYVPSPTKVVAQVLDELRHYCTAYEAYTFIDIGAGLGRNLLLASHFPFRKVIGVEIATELAEVAKRNIEIYHSTKQKCYDLEMACVDALDFQFPSDNLVLYFYWPFPEEVSRKFVKRLEEHLLKQDAHVVLIFLNGVFSAVEQSSYFDQEFTYKTTDLTGLNALEYTVNVFSNMRELERRRVGSQKYWSDKLKPYKPWFSHLKLENQESKPIRLEVPFSEKLSALLLSTAKHKDFNCYKLLLSALAISLGRWSEEQQLLFASPALHLSSDKAAGWSYVKLKPEWMGTGRNLLRHLHAELEMVLAHQPYATVSNWASQSNGKDEVFFPHLGFGYNMLQTLEEEFTTAHLSYWVQKEEGSFSVCVSSGQGVISAKTLEAMAEDYLQTIEQLCKDLDRPISAYPTTRVLDWDATLQSCISRAGQEVSRPIRYSLSPQQKRIFILQHFDEDSTSYNMPFLYPVMATTELEYEQLKQVFLQLLERHEILRTSFYFHEGQPAQEVLDTIDFHLEKYEGMDENEALERFVRPFDLERAPLLRAGILENADAVYLLFDAHHIVFDGWSQQILLQEIRSLLEGQLLPALPIQYKDYVAWLNAPAQRQRLKGQQHFWLQTFNESPPLLELPTDFERPEIQQFDGASVSFALSNREKQILRRICEERKTTLYVVLLTIWKILLAKWTNQHDLVVGTPVAGRNHPDLERLIGMFVNTLPLRTQPKGEKTFTTFLSEVRDTFIEALDHQDYPFEELVEHIWDVKLKNRNPIFDTMFGFVDRSQLDGFYERISEELHFNQESGETKFDLHLTATDYEDEVGFELSYSTTLFSQSGIKKLVAYFRKVIAELDQFEDCQLADIDILSEEEKERLIQDYNNTDLSYDYDQGLLDLIEKQAKLNSEKIALRWEGEDWTYEELNQQANRLAHYLRHQGVEPGVRVAVCLERSPALIVSLLGILKAGGAYVPIDPNYPKERINYIFEDAQAALAIISARSQTFANGGEKKALIVWDELQDQLPSWPTKNLALRLHPADLAYIIYTSGSTGKPKGVMIGHGNVQAFIQWCLAEFCESPFEWVYAVTSVCFDLSIFEIFFTLSAGKSIRLLENGLQIKDYLEKDPQVLINTVPSVIQNLQEAKVSWDSVTLVNMAGEPIPEQVKDRLDLERIEGRNLYGPSEDTTYSTFFRLQKDQPVLIGKPIGNTQVYLLDQDMNLRPSGLVGELCLSGAGVAQGYWKRPALTADKFLENPFNPEGAKLYRTGDLARWLPDGNLAFLGRNDHQVKIRGYRIELGEIERTLLDIEGIRRAVVVAKQTIETGESLVAAYVVGEGLEVEQIRQDLQVSLPAYMIPSLILIMDALPLTPNGKIDKKALPDPQSTATQEQRFVAPQTPTELALASVWEEILKVKPIGVLHNFFDLGGQSLIATQMIAAVKERLQCSITIREIFKHPTIQQLAAAIDREENPIGSTFSWNKPARPGRLPLSYAQERMWVIDSLEGSTQYHIPIVLDFSSAANRQALMKAFETLIERHEILRTVYRREEDQLFQQILPPGQWKWIEKECQGEQLTTTIADEVLQAFDLAKDHPIRATWLQLSPEQGTLVIVFHHIAVDEWSLAVITTELEQLYTAYNRGVQPNLPPLSGQYADYAVWQRTFLKEEKLIGSLQYWKEKLKEVKPLSFPTDFPRTAQGSTNGETLSFLLDKNACRKLKKLAKELDVTPFILFLTSLKVLLYRYSGQQDICVGTPVTNRGQLELQDMVGLFLNTIALRTQLDPHDTFLVALAKVKENVLDAFAHQQLPFEKVVEAIDVGRDLSQHPIFQILFIWHESAQQKDMEGTAQAFSKQEIDTKQVKFDLSFHLEENEDDVELLIEYCVDLYSAETIRQLARHFNQLLIDIATDQQVLISAVNLLSAGEREQLLTKANQKADFDPLEATIIDLFEEQVDRTPDHIAMVFEDRSWTYQELNRRANQLAHYIDASGEIEAGDAIAVIMDRSDWYAVTMISILKLGAVYVPIDRSLPATRLNYMIEDCGAKVVLVDTDLGAAIDTGEAKTLVLATEDDLDQHTPYNLRLDIAEDATAFVIYTSGSTGQPKGVEQTHKMLYNLIQWDRSASGLLHGQKHLQFSAFSFDSSLHDILYAVTTGGEVHILSESCRRDLRLVKEYIIAHEIGTLSMPYAALKPLFGLGTPEDFQGHQLQEIISTGEQLYINGGLRDFLEANPTVKIFNLYGPSETHVVTVKHYAFAQGEVPIKSTIGKPIANTSLFILDDKQQLAPIGVPGELFIGGANLAKGYLGKDQLTLERFIADPFNPGAKLYNSGDLARWLHSGEIEYLGRRDDQVKIRGFRIELGEVEAVLQKAPFVNQCVVLVKADAQGNKRLVAYLEAQEGYNDAQLRDFMAEQLPEHLIPALVVEMEALPLNHNGKVDKRRLPEPQLQAYDNRQYMAPGSPLEKELVQIWKSVLGVEEVGVLNDFFRLGGHSINAVQVAANIAKSLGVELPLRTFFQHRNIQELAKVVDRSKQSYVPIPAAPQLTYYPTTSAQKRLFVIQELSPHSTAYNIPQVHDWDASITKERLLTAFTALVDRHTSLRTIFALKNGVLVQAIVNELNYEIESFTEEISEEAILRAFVRPFDLRQGPLFRIALWETPNRTHLLFDIHHIITDEVSDQILQKDLHALLNGQTLKAIPVQLYELAHWQSLSPQLAQLKLQQSYWLSLFTDIPSILNLPIDYPRAKVPSFEGSSVCFNLTADQTTKINQLSVEADTSIYVVLLAFWGVYLSKLGRSEDLVVGTIVNGRNHPDLETTVGMFVKTLPLRLRPTSSLTFLDFLKRTDEAFFSALANQDFSLEELVEQVWDPSILGRNPLFDTTLSFFDKRDQPIAPPISTQGLVHGASHKHAKFDLSLTAVHQPEYIDLELNYKTSLFSRATAEGFLTKLIHLIDSICLSSEHNISQYDIILSLERQKLLKGFQGKSLPQDPSTHLLSLLETQFEQSSKATAVVTETYSYSYEELDLLSNQLANYLAKKLDGKSGQLIGIKLERTEWLIVAILGILKSGNAYVPLSVTDPVKRIEFIIEDSQCQLLVDTAMIEDFRTESSRLNPARNNSSITTDDLAYVIYTSGSTGKPKGCLITHGNVVNLITAQIEAFDFGKDERLLLLSNSAFDASVEQIFLALCTGAQLHLLAETSLLNPKTISNYIEEQRITHIHTVPSFLSTFTIQKYQGLRRVIAGGEKCPPSLAKAWAKYYVFYNEYGPTETTVTCVEWKFDLASFDDNSIPLGKPLANVEIYILDDQLRLLPIGAKGEICVGGAGVGLGYLNRPDLTKDKFVDHPFRVGEKIYRTGDIGSWSTDGQLRFIGRKDDQVKLRGFRIELGEIENSILQLDHIEQVVALVKADNIWAFVQAQHEIDLQEIKAELSTSLPSYMLPHKIIQLDQFPQTSSGKVDKKALALHEGLQPKSKLQKHPAGTPIERVLLVIWEDLLLLDEIGVRENFFELGGHSILSMKLIAAVQERFDLRIGIKDILLHPTIELLAQFIEEGCVDDSLLVPLNRHKPQQALVIAVPPILGTSNVFWSLAQLLEERQINCFGLQYYGYDQEVDFDPSIQAMAQRFFTEIKEGVDDKSTPITLLGYSMGGAISFELMGLLEEEYPNCRLAILDRGVSYKHGVYGYLDRYLSPSEQITELERLHLGKGTTKYTPGKLSRIRKLLMHNHQILQAYKPRQKINSPLLAIEAELEKSKCRMKAWRKYTKDTFEHHYLISDHFSILSKEVIPQVLDLLVNFVYKN